MDISSQQHTLDIFQRAYARIKGLLPSHIDDDVSRTMKHYQEHLGQSVVEAEEALANMAKRFWPYYRAFHELFLEYKEKLAEEAFLSGASRTLKKRYKDFVAHGGTFANLENGRESDFFSPDERAEIRTLFIQLHQDIAKHTHHAIESLDARHFQERVRAFRIQLDEMEDAIHSLQQMADEIDHAGLSEEIRSHIEGIHHSFLFVGPPVDYIAIMNAVTHFEGRKKDILH